MTRKHTKLSFYLFELTAIRGTWGTLIVGSMRDVGVNLHIYVLPSDGAGELSFFPMSFLLRQTFSEPFPQVTARGNRGIL